MDLDLIVKSIATKPMFYDLRQTLPNDWREGVEASAKLALIRLLATGPIAKTLMRGSGSLAVTVGTTAYTFHGSSATANDCGQIEIIVPPATSSVPEPDALKEFSSITHWLAVRSQYSNDTDPVGYYHNGVDENAGFSPKIVMVPDVITAKTYTVYFSKKKSDPAWGLIDDRWAGHIAAIVLADFLPESQTAQEQARVALFSMQSGISPTDRSQDTWENPALASSNFNRNYRRTYRYSS